MLSSRAHPIVSIAVIALIGSFALAFGFGKLTKEMTVAAPIPQVQIVPLSSETPQVSRLQTGAALPALKLRRKQGAPASTNSRSSAPVTPSAGSHAPIPQPVPAPSPRRRTQKSSEAPLLVGGDE
jgi:hypothetical protein